MREFRHKRYLIRIVEYGWSSLDKGARQGRTIYSRSVGEQELSKILQMLTLLDNKVINENADQ